MTSLPPGSGWLYEAKYDGFRTIASVNEHGAVSLTSRKGTALGVAFPEVREAVAEILPPGTVADGEIVFWGPDVRLDFFTLVRRMSARPTQASYLARTHPCHLVLFDLLRIEDRDVMGLPLIERRALLESLLADLPGKHLVTHSLQTSSPDEAKLWLEVLPQYGVEGLVIKAAGQSYQPGRRAWFKLRSRETYECLVGAVVGPLASPERLVLRRYDGDRLRIVAMTGLLDPAARAELAPLLTPTIDSPWPKEIVFVWGRPPVAIKHVRPELVVEVSADTAVDQGQWRHLTRYVRPRPDLGPEDVPPPLGFQA